MHTKMKGLAGHYFAHRGLHDPALGIPENSLPAFEAAAKAGYGTELDVRLSADGVLMVFHDDDLNRMCGCTGSVETHTAAELRRLQLAGTGYGIPTLKECLKALNGTPLIVEIKGSPRMKEAALAAAAALAAYPGPWCVESFYPGALRVLRRKAPGVARGQLALSRRRPGHWGVDTIQRYLLHLPLTRPDFVAYEIGGEESAFALWAVKRLWRIPLAGWTITTPEQGEAARKAGCVMQIFEGWRP